MASIASHQFGEILSWLPLKLTRRIVDPAETFNPNAAFQAIGAAVFRASHGMHTEANRYGFIFKSPKDVSLLLNALRDIGWGAEPGSDGAQRRQAAERALQQMIDVE